MKKYTVEKELPDLFDIGIKLYQTRNALQSIINQIDDSIEDIVGDSPAEDRARINGSVSSLWIIVDELENINEMIEALDTEDSRKIHLAFIKKALFTPENQRTNMQSKALKDNGLDTKNISPEEVYEKYAAELETRKKDYSY